MNWRDFVSEVVCYLHIVLCAVFFVTVFTVSIDFWVRLIKLLYLQ
jgi:hypothetical protein